MNIIESKNINKSYGSTVALKDVSINIRKGVIFALIGPNGAGKTTYVKTLLDIIKPASGQFIINGKASSDISSREEIAFMPEKFNFFSYYTVKNVLMFYGKMYGIERKELSLKVDEALKKLNIEEIRNKKISKISKGQLQRTGIASILLMEPLVYIFDEPFSGLDPIGIKELKNIFKELKDQGTTVFINSHILSEVEQICDDVAILNKGECLAQGTIESLTGDKKLEDYFYGLIVPEEKK